ncbi:hypothetical protein [Tsukamurella soli]|uniref:SPW repeat-containing protein n=1 Tax=Tsukamurella soli TaxID=644556 RepID=A0ABP8JV78_9ACTN
MNRDWPRLLLLAALTLAGAACAVGGTMYLPAHVGSAPMPVSAVVAGLMLAMVSVAAQTLTGQGSSASLPVLAFLVVIVVFLLGGPGDSVTYTDWRVALLLGCGVGLPALAWYVGAADRLRR